MKAIVDHVISKWEQFTIWNAGKEGRRLYRSLSHFDQQKVLLHVSCFVCSYYEGHDKISLAVPDPLKKPVFRII